MTDHPGFSWSDRYLLGYCPMDSTHQEFVTLVDALLTASDATLSSALSAFACHAESHFSQENEWMKNSNFPAADCHIDEHDKVLASVYDVQEALEAGDTASVRELAVALMEWFPAHADYMDSALAIWLVRREHAGASPLVFRRSVKSAAATSGTA